MKNIQLIHGDAFEELPKLAPGSVDCILTDPPYGTTQAGHPGTAVGAPLRFIRNTAIQKIVMPHFVLAWGRR